MITVLFTNSISQFNIPIYFSLEKNGIITQAITPGEKLERRKYEVNGYSIIIHEEKFMHIYKPLESA